MKPKDPRFIRRREFLISTATLAGAGLPAIGWAASKPCPPSTLSVTGGSSTTSSCASSGAAARSDAHKRSRLRHLPMDFRTGVPTRVTCRTVPTSRAIPMASRPRSVIDGPTAASSSRS